MAEVVERVANLEARFDAHGEELVRIREAVIRLDEKMERRFEAVDRRFEVLDQRMEAGFAELRTDFRWVMGAIGGGAITVILAIFSAVFSKGWVFGQRPRLRQGYGGQAPHCALRTRHCVC